MATILLDDLSERVNYGGGTWSRLSGAKYLGGTSAWSSFAESLEGETGIYGTLNLSFRGTGIAFFGDTPMSTYSQFMFVSIDGAAPYNTSYADPSPQSTRQWYQSPNLADTDHNITITHLAGTSVDFAVINAGRDTSLANKTLIIDDTDPSIKYKGNWAVNSDPFLAADAPVTGLPFGNSTHQTSTPGAGLTFEFTGTSVALFGIWDWGIIGAVTIAYTLDGTSFYKAHVVTPQNPKFVNGDHQQPNFELISIPTLAAGKHTLELEITACTLQTLTLDYFLYKLSFDTLAEIPNLGSTTVPPPSSSPSTTGTFTSTSTTKSSVSPGPSLGASRSPEPYTIAAGVLGGMAFLAIIALLFFCRKRLFRKNSAMNAVEVSRPARLEIEPFVPPPVIFGHPGTVPRPNTPAISPVIAQAPRYHSRQPSMHQHFDMPSPPSAGILPSPTFPTKRSGPIASSSQALDIASSPGPQPLHENTYPDQGGGDDGDGYRDSGGTLRNRTQHLQSLVQELDLQLVNGANAEGADSFRISELRTSIAGLARQDGVGIPPAREEGVWAPANDAGTHPPPAYGAYIHGTDTFTRYPSDRKQGQVVRSDLVPSEL